MKRKRNLIILIVALLIVVFTSIGYNIYRFPAMFRNLSDESLSETQVEELREEILSQSDPKVLVAYFSYSGTTEDIATALSEKTGGDLFEITIQNAYSDVYKESNAEIRRNEKPKLADTVSNMDEYDIVFVGYPVWWHATPAPVNSFLESYDLSGKLVIPFCTSGESDISETMPTFLNSCEGVAVYGERRISGTSQIDGWLSELGLSEVVTMKSKPAEEKTSASAEGEVSENTDGKTLVVYFSWSGNTAEMASHIVEQTGGDLYEIEPKTAYPTDYSKCGDIAKVERDENARPEIANLPVSIDEYDTILVGYPIWWHTAPMIVGTFLENYDLTGVDVYPFTQSASMDTEQFDNSMNFVRENADGANVHDGLFVNSSDTTAIDHYLSENKLVK